MTGQICCRCKVWKDKTQFWKQNGRAGGLHAMCKECGKKRAKEYRRKHHAEIYAVQLEWNKRNPERMRLMRNRADFKRGRTSKLLA